MPHDPMVSALTRDERLIFNNYRNINDSIKTEGSQNGKKQKGKFSELGASKMELFSFRNQEAISTKGAVSRTLWTLCWDLTTYLTIAPSDLFI